MLALRQQMLDPDWLSPAPEQAGAYLRAAKAENTRRAYRADWEDFSGWCANRGREALPASAATLALYLTERAESVKVATLTRRLSAISQAHQIAGYDSPTQAPVVRQLMSGVRRTRGTAPVAKRPVLVDDLKAMLANLPATTLGIRDRALLLLGFTGAFRRSELVALDCEDLATDNGGLVVTVRRSKTDAEGQGRSVGIPFGSAPDGTCPVAAVAHWREAAGIRTGPLFRVVTRYGRVLDKRLSGEAVGLVVKRWAENLGYDPGQFGGHSLRAGLATSAAIAGKSERVIMQQTGHRSVATLRRYIREGNLFRENAAEGLGL